MGGAREWRIPNTNKLARRRARRQRRGRGSGFEGVWIPEGAGPRTASQGQGPKIRVFPGAEAGRASALSVDGVSAGERPGSRGAARRESRPSGGASPLDGREGRPPPCLPCNRLPP